MATTSTNIEEPSQPLKYKTWVLKVSIHCEGCKKKVKKVLTSIQGIHNFDVDLKLQRVVVTGNVDADTLIYKLIKSGRKAELWPGISNQKQKMSARDIDNNKEKISDVQTIASPSASGGPGDKLEKQTPGKLVVNPATADQTTTSDVKVGQPEVTTAKAGGVAPAKVNQVENIKTTTKVNHQPESLGVPTTTSKDTTTTTKTVKMNEEGGRRVSSGGEVEALKEKKVDAGGGGGGGGNKPETGMGGSSSEVEKKSGGKKKKKKGQNGNMSAAAAIGPQKESSQSEDEESISSLNAWRGPHRNNNNSVTPPPPNNNPPRHLENQYPPPPTSNYYYAPHPSASGPPPHGPPQPAYVMSYNMAHPTPNYTTSYYASPTPYSSSSSYSSYQEQRETAPPSSSYYDYSYARVVQQQQQQQPLDSFEMFSDENPNGCSVM